MILQEKILQRWGLTGLTPIKSINFSMGGTLSQTVNETVSNWPNRCATCSTGNFHNNTLERAAELAYFKCNHVYIDFSFFLSFSLLSELSFSFVLPSLWSPVFWNSVLLGLICGWICCTIVGYVNKGHDVCFLLPSPIICTSASYSSDKTVYL